MSVRKYNYQIKYTEIQSIMSYGASCDESWTIDGESVSYFFIIVSDAYSICDFHQDKLDKMEKRRTSRDSTGGCGHTESHLNTL